MSEKLWSPTHETVRNSLLSQFTNEVADQGAGSFDDYDALHQWSVENPADFWAAYWDFAELKASQKGDIAVKDLDRFPGASWFPEAKLNYAENLLTTRSSKTAFVSILENGERKAISYGELYLETNNLQSFLKAHISIGDRVAGWLPNTIETVVAMLATSSLGGVWSSCSPDFGIEGALDRFGQIEPKVLFACDGYFYAGKTIDIKEKVRSVVEQVKSIELIVWVLVLEDTQAAQSKETNWGHWPSALSPAINFEQLAFDHPLYIMYSSGTTGKPKCIVHGQGGTLIQHKKEHQLHLDLRTDDNLFFFTTCGWMMWNWLVSALATGCTITLYDGSPFHPKPDVLFDLIDQESITVFGVSAKFLSNAQKEMVSPVESHQLNSLRCLISTGSPLTDEGFEYVYEKIK